MRLFWMVMRYREDNLQPHPHYSERGVYYMGDVGKLGEIAHPMFPSLESAESHAAQLAQQNPTDTVVVLEVKSVYELPELPAPIKKIINPRGELVPHAK